MMESQDKW